jgi:hypothetical protein
VAERERPVRLNLEFFVGLRNKIEHRYQERIGVAVSGHSQALIINYERELVEAFGTEESLAAQLRFPVFLSSLTQKAWMQSNGSEPGYRQTPLDISWISTAISMRL